jgi:hypothetical protein
MAEAPLPLVGAGWGEGGFRPTNPIQRNRKIEKAKKYIERYSGRAGA